MKNLKSFLLFFLSICLCLSMPFTLTSCKDKNVEPDQPVIEQPTNTDKENEKVKEDEIKYSLVLKNVVYTPTKSQWNSELEEYVEVPENESILLDFAELHLGYTEDGIVGYGFGKVYEQESKIEKGELEAYVNNNTIYVSANIPESSFIGKIQLKDLFAQLTEEFDALPIDLAGPDGNFGLDPKTEESLKTLYADLEELADDVKKLVDDSTESSFNATSLLTSLFTTQEDGENTIYTFNFESIKTINSILATVPVSSIYGLVTAGNSYDTLVKEITDVLDLTVGDIYEKLEAKGVSVEELFVKIDKISADIGTIILNNMPKPEDLPEPEFEVEDSDYKPVKQALEPLAEELEPIGEEEFKIETLEDLLVLFEIELPDDVDDISEYLTSEEVTSLKVADILNMILLKTKTIDSALEIDKLKSFITETLNEFGKKSVYEIVEELMPLIMKSNEDENEELENAVPYKAEEPTFAEYLKDTVDNFVDMVSKMLEVNFKLNASNELLELNVNVKADTIAFEMSVVRDYVTDRDYKAVKEKFDSLFSNLKLDKENMPEANEMYSLTISDTENGQEYHYVEKNTDYPFENIFVFDAEGKLVSFKQVSNSYSETVTNMIDCKFEDCTALFNIRYCGNKFYDVSIATSNGKVVSLDNDEDAEPKQSKNATLHFVYDMENKKFAFDEVEFDHKFVEVEEDREILSYGVKVHYVCQKCNEDSYAVVEFVPNENRQYAFNTGFYINDNEEWYFSYTYTVDEVEYEATLLREDSYLYDGKFIYVYNVENKQWEMNLEIDLDNLVEVGNFDDCYSSAVFTVYQSIAE